MTCSWLTLSARNKQYDRPPNVEYADMVKRVEKCHLVLFLAQNHERCVHKLNDLGHEEDPVNINYPSLFWVHTTLLVVLGAQVVVVSEPCSENKLHKRRQIIKIQVYNISTTHLYSTLRQLHCVPQHTCTLTVRQETRCKRPWDSEDQMACDSASVWVPARSGAGNLKRPPGPGLGTPKTSPWSSDLHAHVIIWVTVRARVSNAKYIIQAVIGNTFCKANSGTSITIGSPLTNTVRFGHVNWEINNSHNHLPPTISLSLALKLFLQLLAQFLTLTLTPTLT